jgi:multidrug efflux system outer membrane protein
MTTLKLLAATASALTLAACAVGPHYQAPQTPPPAAYVNADPAHFAATNPEAAWWRQFEDPVLDDLVAQGLAANLDLKVAVAHVREARALFTDARLDQLPRITASGTYVAQDAQTPGVGGPRIDGETYQVGFDTAWELDLFGRVRHGVEAARAEAGAAEADLRDAQVTVAAEVARNYFELRGAQARLAVAQHNLDTQRETLRLTKTRFEVGQGDPVDVASAQARLSATEAAIPTFRAAEIRAGNRLAVLIGQRPGALTTQLVAVETRPPLAKALPIGDAATLLRRRPDVAAAERRLAAQTARTGVATADLFPRVRIGGFFGLLSGDIGSLGDTASQAWSVTPTITWPGLDMVGARARLHAQEARGDASLAVYDRTVLTALEDVENSLASYGQEQARLKSLADQVTASRRAADLARIRYREGAIDFLVLLDAERTRLEAEDALSASETAAKVDVVAVYKALGGGWEATGPKLAQAAP